MEDTDPDPGGKNRRKFAKKVHVDSSVSAPDANTKNPDPNYNRCGSETLLDRCRHADQGSGWGEHELGRIRKPP